MIAGTVCWTAQILPQVWKSWREKSTDGLSHWLVSVHARCPLFLILRGYRLLWGAASPFLGAYGLIQNLNIPLILQPQLFGFLSFVSWGQVRVPLLWREKVRQDILCISSASHALVRRIRSCCRLHSPADIPRAPAKRCSPGVEAGVRFLGICSSVIIAGALIPQYVVIYRMQEVVGISMVFMAVDMLGGVFSDLSLVFKGGFDVVAGITYSVVVVMDGLVIVAALILNPRAAKRRSREKEMQSLASTQASTLVSRQPSLSPV
ncbi:unnamed protein product [Mycena citricolor]|uniref:Uncharacterized protein n=1 Tax=Mycena citricolor TaxID=2018698 RepID=A0AAD2JYV3_9AGAR|nr:unnamed protein product [Mycena citricolor]